jgi:NDP-sugar pyrophosphorylase family protein
MKILLPMAGAGKRFAECGYDKPKPLIDVMGKPMIERVIENLGYENDYVFLVQKSHLDLYGDELRKTFSKTNSYKIVEVPGLTEGAACTALLAEDAVSPQSPLMIANTDQIMDWNRAEFYDYFYTSSCDGVIFTFKSLDKKHSYAKLDALDKYVTEVAEKVVISNNATVGVYVWRTANMFFNAAKEMIRKNIRTNNEFYICPAYNVNIEWQGKVEVYPIRSHHPIGTPEDLIRYLRYKGV